MEDNTIPDNTLRVHFTDRIPQDFNTISFNCQGGFFMIYESNTPVNGKMRTTCFPSWMVDRVEISQNT